MTFAQVFKASASGKMVANYTIDPEILLPNKYEAIDTKEKAFLSLLGGGSVQSEQLFSVSFAPMAGTYLLLYTTEGAGILKTPEIPGGITLSQNSVLLWDCQRPFTLSTSMVPWNFFLFFLEGKQLEIYGDIGKKKRKYNFTLSQYSPVHQCFRSLLGIPERYKLSDALQMNQILTEILTDISLPLVPKENVRDAGIPSYLYELKDRLDHHFRESFSLAQYEELFSINKYRICREFSRYFHSSPLAYLTQVRLNKAKEMLLTTDLNIYEISSYVGYENVNHFISLFRKYNGTTPNAFKQKARENQSGSHSPGE